MSPEIRLMLTSKLAETGLTVLKTDDYKATLRQLARLARFERLMLNTAAGNPMVEVAVEHVRKQMDQDTEPGSRDVPPRIDPGQCMELEDIPLVLRTAHAGLHNYLSGDASLLDPKTLPEIIDGTLDFVRNGRALNNMDFIRVGLVNSAVFALIGLITINRLSEERA